ncbi:MAG TPA: hypothetical protein VK167_05265 [Flavipsychrobacter sp.]|jgi:hypothetical protein|nr:hypothetical protein [Chitinophagales bacterium]HLO70254.1 hypothetical protein [Flavipsychrobacter sp.]
MITTNEVYRKIKEISGRTANPRPMVNVDNMAAELNLVKHYIIPMLTELKDMRLISFDKPAADHVKLTLLGFTVKR